MSWQPTASSEIGVRGAKVDFFIRANQSKVLSTLARYLLISEFCALKNESLPRFLTLYLFNACALLVATPWIALCYLESVVSHSHRVFQSCGHFFAILPGHFGMYVRRAFYIGTLKRCSQRCHIGFGSLIRHRGSILEDHVYIGDYALLGEVILRQGCLIGSRASILSQGEHHFLDEEGRWSTLDHPQISATEIGEYSWIGEGAIIASPVGRGARVAAGTVVANQVPEHVMVAGNPARFVKKLLNVD